MAKLKVPSLQHLARMWREDPQAIKRTLVNLVKSSPTFSYEPFFECVRDLLVFHTPYEQVADQITRGIKRPHVRENFLGLLPLVHEYFADISPTFVQGVAPRYYPVGRDLMVPFRPPLIYGTAGDICFPWFSFWRNNPLSGEQLSLFVTMVDEVLLQDPDLEGSTFTILDFCARGKPAERKLSLTDARDIQRLTAARELEMLEVFAEGYRLAQVEIRDLPSTDERRDKDNHMDPSQRGLFDS